MSQENDRLLSRQIIRSALVATCRDMAATMARTAFSPIFSDGRDFSVAILDPGCEVVAQANGCPAQLGALSGMAGALVAEVGLDNIRPGDVLLHNDVYRSGTHLPEFCMLRPVFIGNTLLFYLANIAHHVDIGGKSAGGFPGDATDVFMEGFRLPPIKLFEAGNLNRDVWRIYLANVRTPRHSFGDLHAMHGSLLVGENRIHQLVKKYGFSDVKDSSQWALNYSESRMRREIQSLPDGCYEAEDYMEDDGVSSTGQPLPIHVRICVSGNEVIVDFTGSAPQTKGPINCPFGVTASAVYNAFLQLTDPTIPTNSGCFRPIIIIAPPGTIVNVKFPGAEFAGNTETHNRIVNVIHQALADVSPRQAGCDGGTCCNLTYGGTTPAGEAFANYQWEGVGWGGRPGADGNSVVNADVGNSHLQSIEVLESRFPILIRSLRLTQDSGGPGQYRGGLGSSRVIVIDQDDVTFNGIADRAISGPPGIKGGMRGGVGGYFVKRVGEAGFRSIKEVMNIPSPSKFAGLTLNKGDQLKICSPGGGGWGDPRQRDPELIMRDLANEYISAEAAEAYYGWVHPTQRNS